MRLPAYRPRLRAIVWLPVGANHDPGMEFAPDSPLEGDGFELPVPREIGAGAPLSKRLWE
jgi:hypothetical protein